MRTDFKRVIDTNLSGLRVTPYSHQQLLTRIQKGEPMKRKMSVGLAIALSLLLLTAVAVAAVLLGGKDMVEKVIAPMAQESEGNRFTKEEVEKILAMAQEHGVELDEVFLSRLQKEDGYYKEELARMFAKQELGMMPDTWSVEDQYWYGELYALMDPDVERTAALPEEGELNQQKIEEAARDYIAGNTIGKDYPVLDNTQYEAGRTFTAVRQNPYYILREWSLTFRPRTPDLPRFSLIMTPQGEVTQYMTTLGVMEHGTPMDKAANLVSQFAHIYSDIYGRQDGYTQETWQDLRDRLTALGITPEEAEAAHRRDMAQMLQQGYTPPDNAISREQAIERAIAAVKEQYKVSEESLRAGQTDYRASLDYVYAIYLEHEGLKRWKVSFGFDYLAEVDAITGKAELTDVYSPGNDYNRRYVLDALIPADRRAYATPRPVMTDEEIRQAGLGEFFPTNLEAAPQYYWDALQGIGYNADTATGIFTRLNTEYGLGDRYWPVLYQAMVDHRNGEATPGGVFRGIPAPEDILEEDAVKLAFESLRAASDGRYEPAYVDSLKPVVQFVYNSLKAGSRTWQIMFADFDENPMGNDFAQVVINAETGETVEVDFLENRPSEVDGIPYVPQEEWSAMGDDGRPAVWGNPAAPEAFWQRMAQRGDTKESVARDLETWAEQYGENTAFWPTEQKAVMALWRFHTEDAMRDSDIVISGFPLDGHISQAEAEGIAWEALKNAGKDVYTREDLDSARLALHFGFSKGILPADAMWQIEFMDERTNYATSIGMVWLDATDGTVINVDTQVGNG